MASEIKGDQRIDRNLFVGGYFEIENESGVVAPSSNTRLRIHKKPNDDNLYLINSAGNSYPLLSNLSSTSSSGVLPVSKGGTGSGIVGTDIRDGDLLIGDDAGNNFVRRTLTAGSNVTITNSAGNISISAASGSGSASGASFDVAQSSHGLVVGNTIYHNGSNYVKAKADNALTAEKIGVVSAAPDTNNFTVLLVGPLTLATTQWDAVTGGSGGLTSGSNYFLSETTSGNITLTEPGISNLVLRAVSTTKGIIKEFDIKESNQIIDEEFTTTASGTAFTLTHSPVSKAYTWLTIDNIPQNDDAYTLSSNTLTLDSAPGTGIVVKVKYALQLTFSSELSQYILRKTVSINDNATSTITAIFGAQLSGIYEVWRDVDPLLAAKLSWNGTTLRVESADPRITTTPATANKLNIYELAGVITLENKTGSSINLVLRRNI